MQCEVLAVDGTPEHIETHILLAWCLQMNNLIAAAQNCPELATYESWYNLQILLQNICRTAWCLYLTSKLDRQGRGTWCCRWWWWWLYWTISKKMYDSNHMYPAQCCYQFVVLWLQWTVAAIPAYTRVVQVQSWECHVCWYNPDTRIDQTLKYRRQCWWQVTIKITCGRIIIW